MAAPNIAALATITGITSHVVLSTTQPTGIVTNASGSNAVYKVNNIRIANTNNGASRDVSITYGVVGAGAGTSCFLASNITVPSNAALQLLDKDSFIYMEEGTVITGIAQTANELNVAVVYEKIEE